MKPIFNVIRKILLTLILLLLLTPAVFAADYPIGAFENKLQAAWEGKSVIDNNKNFVYWGNGPESESQEYTNYTTPTILTDNVIQSNVGSNKSPLIYAVVKSDNTLWYQSAPGDETDGKLDKITDNVKKVYTTEADGAFLKTDGTLWFWGLVGEFGADLTDYRYQNVDIRNPLKVADNVADFDSSGRYVLKDDGSFVINTYSLDASNNVVVNPNPISSDVKSIDNDAFIKNDNTLWDSGLDYRTKTFTPVQIDTNVTQASENLYLKSDGTVWTYEIDYEGKLTTKQIDSDGALIQGSYLYIKNDKSLWEVEYNAPSTKILDNVVNADLYEGGGLAITADGKVYSWGTNTHGQLGNGTVDYEDNNYTEYPPTEVISDIGNVSPGSSQPSQPSQPSNPTPDPTPNPTPDSGNAPIYRLYNEGLGEHLYTSDKNEYDTLVSQGWNGENIGWNAPTSGKPVYRLYNPALRDHLYTTDSFEVQTLTTQQGWQTDNNGQPLFYSGGSTPIYRLYNPGTLRHLLTKDTNEYDTLGNAGWSKEGEKLNCLS